MSDTKAPTLPTRQEVAALREVAGMCPQDVMCCECKQTLALCALIEVQERLLKEAQAVLGLATSGLVDISARATLSKLEAFNAR